MQSWEVALRVSGRRSSAGWEVVADAPCGSHGPEVESGATSGEQPQRLSDIRELRAAPEGSIEGPHRLVSAALEPLRCSWHEEVVHSRDFAVLVASRTRARVRVPEGELMMPPGSIALIPPGVPFSQRTEAPAATDWLSLVLRTDELKFQAPVVLSQSTGRARELAGWLVAEQREPSEAPGAYGAALLQLFVLELKRLQADGGPTLERSIRAYILSRLPEAITLKDLAGAAGMSRYHFCRLYHRLSGESPMTTVRNLRLERARELALTTDLSLREIAVQVGVSSHCHLSRTLRSHFGIGVRGMRASTYAPGRSNARAR